MLHIIKENIDCTDWEHEVKALLASYKHLDILNYS